MRTIHLFTFFTLTSIAHTNLHASDVSQEDLSAQKDTYVIVNAEIIPKNGKSISLTYVLKSDANTKQTFQKIFTTNTTNTNEGYANFYVLNKHGERKQLARNKYSNLHQYLFNTESDLKDINSSFQKCIIQEEKKREEITHKKKYKIRKDLQSILKGLAPTSAMAKKEPHTVTIKKLFPLIKKKLLEEVEKANQSTTGYTRKINPDTSIMDSAIPEDTESPSRESYLSKMKEDIKTKDEESFRKEYLPPLSGFLLSKKDMDIFISQGREDFHTGRDLASKDNLRRMISARTIHQQEKVGGGALFDANLVPTSLSSDVTSLQQSFVSISIPPSKTSSSSETEQSDIPSFGNEEVETPSPDKSTIALAAIGTIAGATTGLTYLNRKAAPAGKKRKRVPTRA